MQPSISIISPFPGAEKKHTNSEFCPKPSEPSPAHVERLSVILNANSEEMENGGQIDPFTAC